MENLRLLFESPFLSVQLLLDGVLIGAIFALAAYGMALVWGVMGLINVAQGELVMLGGYAAFYLYRAGIHPLFAVPLAAAVLFAAGWLLYRAVIFRVVDKDLFISILATFGLSILLQQLANTLFGADVRTAESGFGTLFLFGGAVTVSSIKLIAFGAALLTGAFLMQFLRRSRMGQAIRATAQNSRAARVMGIDTGRVYAWTFGLNAAICGASGALVAMTWVVHPYLGLPYTVRSFMIVIIAGLGNVAAVLAAALGLGVAENFAGFIFGAEYQAAFVFVLLVVIPRAEVSAVKAPPLRHIGAVAVVALAILAPVFVPAYRSQLALLWVMIVFALTWDLLGGQMGYNSFGNVLFFGVGMYACVIIQRDARVGYFTGLFLGSGAGAVLAVALAALLGSGILGLRGHYFAIGTLGLGIAAGELAGGWQFVGGGGGMVPPLFPGEVGSRETFFYYLCFALAALTLPFLRWLYASRFGLVLNAIRDDEDKAEAMGLRTTRYKTAAWCISAFFLGLTGGAVGNLLGFIDPREVAFAGSTFGVWMVLMAILGGKGTLWGPVIGAVVFHVTKELFWTYLLGWQRVALGLLIVVIVVFFPVGILGWARERWPERFGDEAETGP